MRMLCPARSLLRPPASKTSPTTSAPVDPIIDDRAPRPRTRVCVRIPQGQTVYPFFTSRAGGIRAPHHVHGRRRCRGGVRVQHAPRLHVTSHPRPRGASVSAPHRPAPCAYGRCRGRGGDCADVGDVPSLRFASHPRTSAPHRANMDIAGAGAGVEAGIMRAPRYRCRASRFARLARFGGGGSRGPAGVFWAGPRREGRRRWGGVREERRTSRASRIANAALTSQAVMRCRGCCAHV
ncbi:hypothetical protein B0H11DRAFT_2112876 [Mycena galericulata]|nr:hypothetical protein B0H11DRAFT_2112876 [Mycena galericulata]